MFFPLATDKTPYCPQGLTIVAHSVFKEKPSLRPAVEKLFRVLQKLTANSGAKGLEFYAKQKMAVACFHQLAWVDDLGIEALLGHVSLNKHDFKDSPVLRAHIVTYLFLGVLAKTHYGTLSHFSSEEGLKRFFSHIAYNRDILQKNKDVTQGYLYTLRPLVDKMKRHSWGCFEVNQKDPGCWQLVQLWDDQKKVVCLQQFDTGSMASGDFTKSSLSEERLALFFGKWKQLLCKEENFWNFDKNRLLLELTGVDYSLYLQKTVKHLPFMCGFYPIRFNEALSGYRKYKWRELSGNNPTFLYNNEDFKWTQTEARVTSHKLIRLASLSKKKELTAPEHVIDHLNALIWDPYTLWNFGQYAYHNGSAPYQKTWFKDPSKINDFGMYGHLSTSCGFNAESIVTYLTSIYVQQSSSKQKLLLPQFTMSVTSSFKWMENDLIQKNDTSTVCLYDLSLGFSDNSKGVDYHSSYTGHHFVILQYNVLGRIRYFWADAYVGMRTLWSRLLEQQIRSGENDGSFSAEQFEKIFSRPLVELGHLSGKGWTPEYIEKYAELFSAYRPNRLGSNFSNPENCLTGTWNLTKLNATETLERLANNSRMKVGQLELKRFSTLKDKEIKEIVSSGYAPRLNHRLDLKKIKGNHANQS